MLKKDPRVDAYIANAAPFARPILTHLRKVIHQGCPEIEETIKWGMPSFEHHGLLCGIAAFQQHCALGFFSAPAEKAMGQYGRIVSLDDLPRDAELLRLVREAARPNEEKAAAPRAASAPRARRLATAVAWIADGKPQGWRYARKG